MVEAHENPVRSWDTPPIMNKAKSTFEYFESIGYKIVSGFGSGDLGSCLNTNSRFTKNNWSLNYDINRRTYVFYWGMKKIHQDGTIINVIGGNECQSKLTDAEYLTYIMILRDIQWINDHLKSLQEED